MPVQFAKPVEDSVPKVDNEVAVGEDLDFQERWWKFERIVWTAFVFILLLDVSGLLGRGPLAHTRVSSADQILNLKYDRVQRTGTPSMLDVTFGPSAIHDGTVKLFVSESLVKQLGSQRVNPQPADTVLGHGGLTYTFPASEPPATVQFELQPPGPGIHHFTVQVPGAQAVEAQVVVVP